MKLKHPDFNRMNLPKSELKSESKSTENLSIPDSEN